MAEPVSRPRAAVILAAGKGERMKSPMPKVLHKVGGRAMLDHAIDTALALGCERVVVVAGAHAPEVAAHVRARLGEGAMAVQDPPLGTGHAVLAAKPALAGFNGDIVVTYADVPLLRAASVEPLFDLPPGRRPGGAGLRGSRSGGLWPHDPGGRGGLDRIVEAKDASPEELLITACNSGVLAADANFCFGCLSASTTTTPRASTISPRWSGREERGAPRARRHRRGGRTCRREFPGRAGGGGVAFQPRRRAQLMAQGVTMTAPETVHLAWDTQIGRGPWSSPSWSSHPA